MAYESLHKLLTLWALLARTGFVTSNRKHFTRHAIQKTKLPLLKTNILSQSKHYWLVDDPLKLLGKSGVDSYLPKQAIDLTFRFVLMGELALALLITFAFRLWKGEHLVADLHFGYQVI